MSVKLDSLADFNDEELWAVIDRSEELLKERDEDRKAKALEQARATLAAVGLSLKDLNAKSRKVTKGPVYHGGHQYQHPTNKGFTWNGRGKKPGWLVTLEAEGGKAIEVAPESAGDGVLQSGKKIG
jgi:DNA-binding protein H-NS